VNDHRLDLRGATAIVTGSMVGVGIFLAPPEVAAALPHPVPFLGLWVLAALGALAGAATYAALGRWRPEDGGDVVYQRAALGPAVAFATGHLQLWAVFCGSAATIAAALGQYQLPTALGIPLGELGVTLPLVGTISGAQMVGALVVLLITAVQDRGLRTTDLVQRALALVPVAALALLSLATLGLAATGGLPPLPESPPPAAPWTLGAIVGAWLAAHFAYSGWNAVVYAAGVVDDPDRTLPRAMVGGTLSVAALYLLICGALAAGLGMGALAEAGEAGTALAAHLGGNGLARGMNALIAVGLLGTIHATLLGGARVGLAMGRSGDLPASMGRVDGRGTPRMALWTQGLWTAALVLTNAADALLTAVALAMVVVGTLTAISLFVLRARDPAGGPRGFGVPALPLLHLLLGLVVVGLECTHALSGDGSAISLLGLGVFGLAMAVGAVRARGFSG
jgi:APA family basic amino acid/polyamine antiporter